QVDVAPRPVRSIPYEAEDPAHVRGRSPVGQVSAVRQLHGEDCVAGLKQAEVDRLVHGRSRQRLYVGMCRPEYIPGPVDRQSLDLVTVALSGIVPATRVALRVLVGEHGTIRGEHLGPGMV